MLRRMGYLICAALLLGQASSISAAVPEGTILIGWHSPEIASPANDSTPDDSLPGVVGLLSGGYDVQNKNSTDGTYGSGPATPASTINAVRVRTDQPARAAAFVTITNKTGSALYLGVFHFDYSRWYALSPKNVALYYDHGDLATDPNTLIGSASELPVSGASGNYSDFDYSLSVLKDVVLENGQSATFRLQVSNAGQADTAGGLDNIAITAGVSATKASSPVPGDGGTDLPRELVLRWTPGESAQQHDVYLGSSFAEVDGATSLNPMGPGQIYRARQTETSYAIPARLDFGRTYYWRIDEVNAPPSSTVYKGDVWSFTVEPYAYPLPGTAITATASSAQPGMGPEKTIDGSGLTGDEHGIGAPDMWLSGQGAGPAWIQYAFDRLYKFEKMQVWNSNQAIEALFGLGVKAVTIESSEDGSTWKALGDFEFARAPGAAGYTANTTVDLAGAVARHVKLTIQSNWGGMPQYGLSEVRFFSVPVTAREPGPASGATGVGVDTALSWRAGREAAQHKLYLSADQQAVNDGTVPATTVTTAGYTPALSLAGAYYWRVDEVNAAETPATWPGDVWSFSTQEYLVVDDFESYTDNEGEAVWQTWQDGLENPANGGSMVGNDPAPYAEGTIVHAGSQSMPLFYNNTSATNSEAVRTFDSPQDWTRYGIKGLTLWFYGDPNNAAQQMYVKINSTKVLYDGNAADLQRGGWQMWYIDLAGKSVNSVKTLSIGLDRLNGVGGQGKVLIDDLRLYSYPRAQVTPVAPEAAGLQAQYAFEGDARDSSGKGRNGTLQGGATFAAGQAGQALSLDGVDDSVSVTGYQGVVVDAAGVQQPFTVAAWIKTATNSMDIIAWGTNVAGQRMNFRVDTVLRLEHGNGNMRGTNGPSLLDDEWHHVAGTVPQAGTLADIRLYVDGRDASAAPSATAAFNLTAGVDVAIGMGGPAGGRFFKGLIDDARIYDRVLSAGEIAGMAGLTAPYDKSF